MLRSPVYVLDEAALLRNLELLRSVSERAGCSILLAQKAFSMFAVYPLLRRYLAGTTASSLFEARLGHDEFGGETHVFSPAYRPEELPELNRLCDHIVVNSMRQLALVRAARGGRGGIGLRVNPGHSEVSTPLYDPCRPGSRLGIPRDEITDLEGVEGLHFHCLCEQGADVLERVLQAFESSFGDLIDRMAWVNFGGGHHITRPDYDVELLVRLVRGFRQRHPGLRIYLEPGEAVVLNAGTLEATVLETTCWGGIRNAILDTSAACHMPDVLEMPYRPEIAGAGRPGEKAFTYWLGGPTCLAGDIIGEYSFDAELRPGDRLVFQDMALYTMVKNNTFNGVALPDIAIRHADGTEEVVRQFGYEDFRGRLS